MKPDPDKRTSAKPEVVDSITFHCYRVGVMQYAWISEDGRLQVQRNYGRETYCASVDGTALEGANPLRAKRFNSQTAAMLAAVFESRRRDRA